MNRILLVEDDTALGATLKERLQKEGYQVEWTSCKSEAENHLTRTAPSSRYDLLILDVGLPDGSGLDLARDVRLRGDMPIIFLSAMNSAEYRLEGFEIGAADYIPKPFHLKELLLRVHKVLENRGAASRLTAGNLSVDASSMSITLPDGQREFPPTRDFHLLWHLIRNAPRAVSRDEILRQVWGDDTTQTGRSIDNAVVRLRHLLRRAQSDHIRSVRGIGYQWVG